MQNGSWRLRSALIVGVILAVVALLGVLRSSQTASPVVPQTAGAVSRDAVAASVGPTVHTRAAAKPVTLAPRQHFLKRAHGAVFNVRNLKSVVVKQERPEDEDPSGPPGGEDEDADAGTPKKLDGDRDQA